MSPLISVIMAAKNEEKYIGAAISSILAQSYVFWELIVSDDGSTDSTKEIVERFCSKDSRITLINALGEGPASARSLAIEKSKGEYIMIMDADDVSDPTRIEKLLQKAMPGKKMMIGSNVSLMKLDGTIVANLEYPQSNEDIRKGFRRLINRSVMMPGTILASRSIHEANPYNSSLKYLEDWDFVLRASEDPSVIFANRFESLYFYRLKPNSVSMDWKSRNRYNIMIWYNERMRRLGMCEAQTLSEFETEMAAKLCRSFLYRLLLFLKFIQHNVWRYKTKKLLGI